MSSLDDMSPEDLEQLKELFEQMGGGFPPTDQSVGGLCNAHEELADVLREFDQETAVRLISSLETIPNLHMNTVRMETLLHLAVSRCKGSRHTTSDELRQWLAFMDRSPMAPLEDPNEDVFIGYVCTQRGGFRVYQGIFSNADFILERLIQFLSKKLDAPGFSEACESVIALLRISDAIADTLSQPRYLPSNRPDCATIAVPDDDILIAHADAVTFNTTRLIGLGIDAGDLEPFLLTTSRRADFDSEPLFGSALELHPLLPAGDGFIVASPSSICRAAIVHAIQAASLVGGWADTFFAIDSSHFFVNEIIPRLGIKPAGHLKLPTAPESIPPLFPMVGQFDLGMPALILTLTSRLTLGIDLEEIEKFTVEQTEDFTRYIETCCKTLEEVQGFKGGLILVGLSNVGRPLAIALAGLRPKWIFHAEGLADWMTLSSDKDFTARRLWYLGIQQELAESANIRINNTAGLLNLYGFWKSNDFALVHQSFDPRNPRNSLAIDGAFSLKLNTELKSISDRHCRRTHDGEWVLLQRQGAGLNPDLSCNRMYVDHAAAINGVLRGCAIHGDFAWWVVCSGRPTKSDASNLLFRLWDCVFNWVEYMLPVIEQELPVPSLEHVKIELEFPGIEEWRIDDATRQSGPHPMPEFLADSQTATIRITIPQGFLAKFYRADNLAEREIVASIISASADVAQICISGRKIQEMVDKITNNQDTRFFHIVQSTSLESAISGPNNAEPTFIPAEEIARARIGLAYKVTDSPPKEITDSKEAQAFLDEAVKKLQTSVCTRLKQLHILPVVSQSFTQLDELSRDGNRWRLSTRSLLALSNNAEWLQNRLRSESGRMALAEITNRALIETAVYSHDPQAQEFISQTEHASLLAELAVMIELANHRDAISGGFVAANLKIHPNGMVDYDETFEREVFQPYLTTRVDDRIRWDAQAYDSYFPTQDLDASPPEESSAALAAFEHAFRQEFGFAHNTLLKVIACFDEPAVSTGRAGGTLDSRSFRLLLTQKIGLTSQQADAFVERFTLPLRPAWDRKLPKGCEIGDVLPWRFFRGVSVLVRPFVEISRHPRVFAISAPHLHRWREYLTRSIISGHLPDRLFLSEAMKSYIGRSSHKRGHEFTRDVAASIQALLPNQRTEIYLTELGAPSDPDLGDIDVLAWDPASGSVFLIECKHLKPALTVRQVIQQLEEFRGEQDGEDSLAKHQRRVEWLKANPNKLAQLTGIDTSEIRWFPLLVTSGRVPMSFVDAIHFSKDQVVVDDDLVAHITSIVEKPLNPVFNA